jgi:hypothetical protein
MMVHGIHDMGAIPLYDYSGLGVDLGAEMALYDFGGVGDIAAQADAYFDGLPGWLQGTVKVAGVLAILGVGLGTVKAASLIPGLAKKKRRNTRRRKRRNPVHARRNRSTRRRRRR